jgi:hypothetical protein
MFRTLATASFALALAACVENNADSGLVILRNIAPATGCTLDAESSEFLASGVIDTASTRGYFFTPVARNDLTTTAGENETQKTIFVEGAHVTIDFFDTDLFTKDEVATFATDGLTRFAVPSSGGIDPNGGLATFGFEIVPAELIALIAPKLPAGTSTVLRVGVQIFGTRAGSSTESNLFRYPVEVCNGCVVHDVGVCESLPADFTASPGGACNPLQDVVLDCCTPMAGGDPVCPAVMPGTQT